MHESSFDLGNMTGHDVCSVDGQLGHQTLSNLSGLSTTTHSVLFSTCKQLHSRLKARLELVISKMDMGIAERSPSQPHTCYV